MPIGPDLNVARSPQTPRAANAGMTSRRPLTVGGSFWAHHVPPFKPLRQEG